MPVFHITVSASRRPCALRQVRALELLAVLSEYEPGPAGLGRKDVARLPSENRYPRCVKPMLYAMLAIRKDYSAQFSRDRLGILLNSFVLFVTKVKFSESACAPISKSYAPITCPFFSSAARISPHLTADLSENGRISKGVRNTAKAILFLSRC